MFQYPKIKKTKKIKEDYNDYFNKLTLDLYHDNAIWNSVKKKYIHCRFFIFKIHFPLPNSTSVRWRAKHPSSNPDSRVIVVSLGVVIRRAFFQSIERVVESKAPLFEAIHEGDSWWLENVYKVVEARSDSWTILVSLVNPPLRLCCAQQSRLGILGNVWLIIKIKKIVTPPFDKYIYSP